MSGQHQPKEITTDEVVIVSNPLQELQGEDYQNLIDEISNNEIRRKLKQISKLFFTIQAFNCCLSIVVCLVSDMFLHNREGLMRTLGDCSTFLVFSCISFLLFRYFRKNDFEKHYNHCKDAYIVNGCMFYVIFLLILFFINIMNINLLWYDE
ncbi:hypothetical protein EDEG_02458 [Edhazardia aedis USNM 41457]|uniref:Transmembrane protein n=1 Tax=Edhazardia aedis (strain USNM 41457) TaxID=1003232 RepID=J8ZU23_EDHAE|nr:hypothetical protein EDEG_02458 [Edhazardia aedis USNM 41457]|eukprot:EJW03153.1 hypothetical protein EDEG_02458 [Edhazardia aedis USNM 41457]